MRTIHKYAVAMRTGPFSFSAPRAAEVVHVAPQHGLLTIWMDIPNSDDDFVEHGFYVDWTGNPIPEDVAHHVATFTHAGLVWHVFTRLPF